MKNNWLFLSYILDYKLSAYGNGERISISKDRSISKGNSSNNSVLNLPTHFGTHIDFPYHFDINGKKGELYKADNFIFNHVCFVNLNIENVLNYTINIKNFKNKNLHSSTDLLIIKSGIGKYRYKDEYWSANPAFSPELASFFRNALPELKAIGFDSISLTGWKFRDIGKLAHKEFLVKNNILIIEDMKLNKLQDNDKISTVIVSPLRYLDMDGSPVTVLAKIIK